MKTYHDGIGEVRLVDYMGSDLSVVKAARVSYGSDVPFLDEKGKKLISYLAVHEHMSPFEHVHFTYRIVAPLFVALQHVRHRTASYNMVSRRYTSENIEFYIPESLHTQDTKDKQASAGRHMFSDVWLEEMRTQTSACFELYQRMICDGVSREEARVVLPQNLYTTYYVSLNLRNLVQFLTLRISEHAQYEIRRVAEEMLDYARTVVPVCMEVLYDKKANHI